MLILLALISVYLGAHWGLLQEDIRSSVADQLWWMRPTGCCRYPRW